MPNLQWICLDCGTVNPTALGNLIIENPTLQYVQLDRTIASGRGTLKEWRPVFDAFRSHPRGTCVFLLNFIDLGGGISVVLEHWTGECPTLAGIQDRALLNGNIEWSDDEEPIAIGPGGWTVNWDVALRLARYMTEETDWELQQWEGSFSSGKACFEVCNWVRRKNDYREKELHYSVSRIRRVSRRRPSLKTQFSARRSHGFCRKSLDEKTFSLQEEAPL